MRKSRSGTTTTSLEPSRAFVDTSGFYALADRSDRHHLAARRALENRQPGSWITTDHVLVETWLLVRSRLGHAASLRLWDDLALGLATLAPSSSADLTRARVIAGLWRDQELSLVDCTSFAFIERLGLRKAVAFDRHFRIYRWGPGRRLSLELPE